MIAPDSQNGSGHSRLSRPLRIAVIAALLSMGALAAYQARIYGRGESVEKNAAMSRAIRGSQEWELWLKCGSRLSDLKNAAERGVMYGGESVPSTPSSSVFVRRLSADGRFLIVVHPKGKASEEIADGILEWLNQNAAEAIRLSTAVSTGMRAQPNVGSHESYFAGTANRLPYWALFGPLEARLSQDNSLVIYDLQTKDFPFCACGMITEMPDDVPEFDLVRDRPRH